MKSPMNVSLKSNGNYEHIKNCVVSTYSHRRCCGVGVQYTVLVQIRRSGARNAKTDAVMAILCQVALDACVVERERERERERELDADKHYLC